MILAVLGLIVVLAQAGDGRLRAAEVMLIDAEVGDGGAQLQGGGGGDGAAGAVDLRLHVKGIGHVADLLAFRDTAAVAGVRLHQLDGVVPEIIQILPLAVKPLAGCQRRSDLLADQLLEIGRQRRGGLLQSVEVVLVAQLAQLDGGGHIGTAMVLHDDVHIAAGLADGNDPLFHHLVEVVGQNALAALVGNVLAVPVIHGEVDLDGVIALGHGELADGHILLFRAPGADLFVPAEL